MINLLEGENINKLVELEKISLISTLDIQKNLNRQILIFMKTFTANIKLSSAIIIFKISIISSLLCCYDVNKMNKKIKILCYTLNKR